MSTLDGLCCPSQDVICHVKNEATHLDWAQIDGFLVSADKQLLSADRLLAVLRADIAARKP